MKTKTGFGYHSSALPCPTKHWCDISLCSPASSVLTAWAGAFRSKLLPTIPCNTKTILHWQLKEHKKAKKGKISNSDYKERNGKARNTEG